MNKQLSFQSGDVLPPMLEFKEGIRRAPKRQANLSKADITLALKNALRYIHPKHHKILASEFLEELKTHGRIYGYRFRPQTADGRIYAKPLSDYKGKCTEGKAIQLMMDNNVDFEVALYPYELVTYGETGQICQNWMQFQLIQDYLQRMESYQTLVIQSGHPLGLFPSNETAPRVILSNGLMIGLYDNPQEFARAAAIGVANYGQMTAGGFMYIGPQGIVHGTFNTLMIAGRKYLGLSAKDDLKGKLFISSGLGGMSGAQGKAARIAKAVSIIAEVDYSRIETRLHQGWIDECIESPSEVFRKAQEFQQKGSSIAIAFYGNIVDLLEYAVKNSIKIDLLSDQTSCHAVYVGGYCPQGLSFAERTKMLTDAPTKFRELVDCSLKRHFELIEMLVANGTKFFDYGNSFLKAVFDAGVVSVSRNGVDDKNGFVFPSYVEDLMGPELFDFGYGPFRWVCLSGSDKDLAITDLAAAEVMKHLKRNRVQDEDNLNWILNAKDYKLVVGSKARILYQDEVGRVNIALKFNALVRDGIIGEIMIGRDHHDTSGTDSPFRETANIKDGSNVMAEMAIHCYAGNAARGMSLVALHNGGGVGTGKSINGGFGLVLDGSERVDHIIKSALSWDVIGGVARRAWARNSNAIQTAVEYNQSNSNGEISIPFLADEELIENAISNVIV